METSDKELPFLNILIKRNDDKIWIDFYFKPPDTHRCLPFSSNHPNHCKKNTPFTLEGRICAIVENQQQKLRHLSESNENLEKCHYPVNMINNGVMKSLEIPQNELRKPKTNKQKNR